jgi:hypothetical protein
VLGLPPLGRELPCRRDPLERSTFSSGNVRQQPSFGRGCFWGIDQTEIRSPSNSSLCWMISIPARGANKIKSLRILPCELTTLFSHMQLALICHFESNLRAQV